MVDLPRRLVAEALGTAFLVATVVGSGVMAERLADGNVALALLGNTIPTGAILVVLILALAGVSGAHFNPAVTVVMAVAGRLERRAVGPYIAAQVLGGLAGTAAAHLMFELPVVQMAGTLRAGPAQWFSEVVATFGLVFTILAIARQGVPQVAAAVGLYITAAYWFTASTSFANPAVTIARAFTDTFSGIAPAHAPAFILVQIGGGLLALAVARWLFEDARQAQAGAREPAS